MPKEETLTASGFAKRWKVHPSTVRRWVRLGHLPTVPLEDWQTAYGPQEYLIPVAEADAAIRKHAFISFGRAGRKPKPKPGK